MLTWATFWISDFEEGGAAELGGGALGLGIVTAAKYLGPRDSPGVRLASRRCNMFGGDPRRVPDRRAATELPLPTYTCSSKRCRRVLCRTCGDGSCGPLQVGMVVVVGDGIRVTDPEWVTWSSQLTSAVVLGLAPFGSLNSAGRHLWHIQRAQ